MDGRLVFLLIVRLTVTYSQVTTIGKVPVKSGGSITLPCLYGAQYRNNVKYLCRGYYWNHCHYVVKTASNSSHKSGPFSISDNSDQGVFNVTIDNLGHKDNDYWCAVEINGGRDEGVYLQLTVQGTPGLSVDSQHMETFTGEALTINCSYNGKERVKWCRLDGASRLCLEEAGQMPGASVNMTNANNVFTVNLSDLQTESSGWYYFDNREFHMPVHVKIKERQSTASPTSAVTTSRDNNKTERDSNNLLIYYYVIPLPILIIIVMAALLLWFLHERHKRAKAQSSPNNAEEELTYTTVKHKSKTAGQTEEQAAEVTYSTLAYN